MYQQIILIGNVGRTPELRNTQSGDPVTSISLAVNKSWVGADGVKNEKTTWFNVTVWRNMARAVAKYVEAGMRVMVIGEVDAARPYQDREGNQRASIEVTATTVKFLGSAEGSVEDGGLDAPQGKGASRNSKKVATDLRDEDIPF